MCWGPLDIDFERNETDDYVEVRIPRKTKHDVVEEQLEFDKITGISSNEPWCNGRGWGEEHPCDAVHTSFPIVNGKQQIISGLFLRLPLGTFSPAKENRVGFMGESKYNTFKIKSWSADLEE